MFLHQCIRDENEYGIEYASSSIIRQLPTRCKIIGIPNLVKLPKFLFPQISAIAYNVWERSDYDCFRHRDRYIDENYDKLSILNIRDIMLDDKLICASDILYEQEAFYEKVRLREEEWDVKVLDFLQERMCEEQLFYELSHPTNTVYLYIANKILELLSMKQVNVDLIIRHDQYEIPIYSTVCSALNLKYRNDILRRWKTARGTGLNGNQMDWEEYIRQYIAWFYPLYGL